MKVDLNDIAVFVEVARVESFSAAGRSLGLPPSSVSRRVARLESALGFKLLHRTTRSVGLTDSGRIYYQRVSRIAGAIDDAERAVHEATDTPGGLLRVTAPPDAGGVIWDLLEGFIADHPAVDLEILHTLEYLDMVEENIDIALRGGSPPDSQLFAARKLFGSRILLAAAPSYLARRGVPADVRDLDDHDCIAMDTWAPNAIRSLHGERGPVRLNLRNRIRVNRLETAQQAALAGFGIAPLLEMTCWRDLGEGRLTEVLRGALPMESGFWIVYPANRPIAAAARALVDHCVRVAPSIAPR